MLLRATVPADIYSSPIVLEVEGLVVHARFFSETDSSSSQSPAAKSAIKHPRSGTKKSSLRGSRRNELRGSPRQEGRESYAGDELRDAGVENVLPPTVDLAQSFLQAEPLQETAGLKAAIESQSFAFSDDADNNLDIGTGTGLSLPGFLAGFLKGVRDRLEVRVKDICISLAVDMGSDGLYGSEPAVKSDHFTVQLQIETLSIEGVNTHNLSPTSPGIGPLEGTRCITIQNIHGMIISNATLFASLSRFPTLSSPAAMQSDIHKDGNEAERTASRSSTSISPASSAGCGATGRVTASSPLPQQDAHQDPGSMVTGNRGQSLDDATGDLDGKESVSDSYRRSTARHGDSVCSDSASSDEASDTSYYDNVSEGTSNKLFDNDAEIRSAEAVLPVLQESHAPAQGINYSRLDTAVESSSISPNLSQSALKSQELALPSYSKQKPTALTLLSPTSTPSVPLQSEYTDNLAHGIQTSSHATDSGEQGLSAASTEDLSESKVFSHDEAESLYMSAISQVTHTERQMMAASGKWSPSNQRHMENEDRPVGHEADASFVAPHHAQSYASPSPSGIEFPVFQDANDEGLMPPATPPEDSDNGNARGDQDQKNLSSTHFRETETTRPPWRIDGRTLSSSETTSLLRKQVLYIDQVEILLPTSEPENRRPSSIYLAPGSSAVARNDRPNFGSRSVYPDVPGAFSVYAERSRTSTESTGVTTRPELKSHEANQQDIADSSALLGDPTTNHEDNSSDIKIGSVHVDLDISIGRSLAITTQKLKTALDGQKADDQEELPKQATSNSIISCNVGFRGVSFRLLEHLSGNECSGDIYEGNLSIDRPPKLSPEADILLKASVCGLDVQYSSTESRSSTQISVEKFILGHCDEDVISFDATLKLRESTRDITLPTNKDVHITVLRTGDTRRLSVRTLPVQLSFNLEKIDETLNRFGGLSGILELGNSIASDATIVGATPATAQEQKGGRTVHFEAQANKRLASIETDVPSVKVDMRLGGVQVSLIGKDCTLTLKSSALKFVSRGEGVGLQVDKIKFSGPYLRHGVHKESFMAALKNIRIELLPVPKEADLGRLLSLLTPSKNKYDDDDDILLDTLLRQRRKGSLIRLTIEEVQGNIACVDDIAYISDLAKEVAKFSKVAKYLPEDDRPGILTLSSVQHITLNVSFVQNIGHIQLALHNMESANVALPLLMAIGVEKIQVHRDQDEELVGKAYSQGSSADEGYTPMIMARVVGDELEPTIRVKLWNVRAEYRVPLMMAVIAVAGEDSTGNLMSDMVSSVATIAANQVHSLPTSNASSQSSADVGHTSTTKLPKLDIVLLDCIVGLNPRDMHSKGLVVLTDTRFSGELRPTGDLEAVLEVQKTSILVIDDVRNIIPSMTASTMTEMQPRVVRLDQISSLCQMGFVSVGYISSAKAAVTIKNCNNAEDKSVDVDLRDDLFVLETCADSTQTLLSIINGLKPPSTPSKETKYRTEVIPVQDMLASLSGDAFAQVAPAGKANSEAPLGMEEGDMVDDEVPQNLEFVNSFYRPELQPSSEEIADSILEDDLGHLVIVPATREIGDKVLLESFREQYEVAPGGEPLDFREDHFGTNSPVPETASNWRSKNRDQSGNDTGNIRASKFRVRVRDVHIIWNQYDGYDWQRTRDTISKAVRNVEAKAAKGRARNDQSAHSDTEDDEESVIGDFLFNSIYIGIPNKRDPRELSDLVNRNIDDLVSETDSYATSNVSKSPSRQSHASRAKGKRLRLSRSKHHKMTFELKGVCLDLEIFASGAEEIQSSLDVRVRDLEVFDHVPTSTWKKFATYMQDAGERQSGSDMIHLEILTVKPVPELEASEFIIKVSLASNRALVD